MLEREAGVEIGRATLDGWVMRVGELFAPVIAAMRRDLLNASYLQADETLRADSWRRARACFCLPATGTNWSSWGGS